MKPKRIGARHAAPRFFAVEMKAERAKEAAVTIKSEATIKSPVTIKAKKKSGRGGARPGAGRKPNGGSEAVRKRVGAHRARRKAAKAGSLTIRDGVGE
jgi:hypothetical protein